MLSLDDADTWCWVLQILNFNVADVEFRCYRLVMFGFVSKRRGGELLMLDVAHNTNRNMVATWVAWVLCQGGGEEAPSCWMLHTTCSQHLLPGPQHARNICSLDRNMLASFAHWIATCSQHLLHGLWIGRLTTDSLPIRRSRRCPMLVLKTDIQTLADPKKHSTDIYPPSQSTRFSPTVENNDHHRRGDWERRWALHDHASSSFSSSIFFYNGCYCVLDGWCGVSSHREQFQRAG
jgi:hypothetical protein